MAYHELVNMVREVNAQRRAIELAEAQAHKSGTFGTIDKDGSRKDFDGKKEKKIDPKSGTSDIDFTWTSKGEGAPTGKNDFKRPKDTDIADERTLEDDKIDRDSLSNPEDRYENMKPTSSVCKQIDKKKITEEVIEFAVEVVLEGLQHVEEELSDDEVDILIDEMIEVVMADDEEEITEKVEKASDITNSGIKSSGLGANIARPSMTKASKVAGKKTNSAFSREVKMKKIPSYWAKMTSRILKKGFPATKLTTAIQHLSKFARDSKKEAPDHPDKLDLSVIK